MDPQFIAALDRLRDMYGRPIVVQSGFRCPEHNNVVSDTGLDGPHTHGCAADLRCAGHEARALLRIVLYMSFSGVGIKQKGDIGARFIHVDTMSDGPRPNVWSY